MCVLKMKFLPSAVQKLSSEQTHRQTDGQTDRQTQLKLLPTAYAGGKNDLSNTISVATTPRLAFIVKPSSYNFYSPSVGIAPSQRLRFCDISHDQHFMVISLLIRLYSN